MLDFISSAYLGLRHPARSLGPWKALTTARPAALGGALLADMAARQVAALQGREYALSGPSTLHLAVDVITAALPPGAELHWDAHLYPVLRYPVQLASRRQPLPAHDVGALTRELGENGTAPHVMVTDGYCVECGRAAPLSRYLAALEPCGGILIVDDTQAIGVFGTPGSSPFGDGGGGSPRAQNIGTGAPIIVLASLAKAFGAPMAVVSGPGRLLEPLREGGFSRQHCSPASIPAARGALRALCINEADGTTRRQRLAQSLWRFHTRCRRFGVPVRHTFHPVQSIPLGPTQDPLTVSRAARVSGLALAPCRDLIGSPLIRLVVTAQHQPEEIDEAAAILGRLLSTRPPSFGASAALH
jgi:8-amino-7-oxononanoate synthase